MSYVFGRKLKEGTGGLIALFRAYEYEILIALCVSFIVHLVMNKIKSRKLNLPPGPTGLPIVGYLPFLSENTFLDFMELGKKYGGVFSIKLGSLNSVILHDAEAIKEAFAKPEFLGRPPNNLMGFVFDVGAFFENHTHIWKEHRRFIVQSMKHLGLGKSKIEGEIQGEINVLLDIMKVFKGEPMNLKEILSPSMSNNICALLFGKRYEYSDPIRKYLDMNLEEGNANLSQTSLPAFFPWILKIPFLRKLTSIDAAWRAFKNISDVAGQEIEKHRQTLDPQNFRDLVDSYLVEIKSRKEKDANTSFTDDMLKANVTTFISAGSETVLTSIMWCIYITAAFPEVQKKIQKEILDVIGLEKSPEFLDQKQMPYTHAVILEIQRWKTVVPLNLVRWTTADTTVGGYDISRGTTVIANFWAVHHDPKLWDEPDSFRPERFLNADGSSIVKSNNYMAFSLGKRSCPGETMAYMEIFMYFTSILQKFDVAFPEGIKPTFEAKTTVTYRLEPYKVRFIPRTA